MMLPHIDAAIVDPEKIEDYLLAAEHPEGSGKAVFFARYGFSLDAGKVLAEALVDHAQKNPVDETLETEYGTKYVVRGSLWCPDGRSPNVCSVWIVDRGSESPRLVTAYPL